MDLLRFACPACARPLELPGEWAGRAGRCPRCRKQVTVPAASEAPPPGPATSPRSPEADRAPCSSCGESIVVGALKCRFCGAAFGVLPREVATVWLPPQPLAGPGERLAAYLLDRALLVPGAALCLVGSYLARSGHGVDLDPVGLSLLGGGAIALGVVVALNTRRLVRTGSTFGKAWLGLCVVDGRGKVPPFGALVVRRAWLPMGIYLASSFLYVGPCLIWLIDKVFVLFATDRRTMRDHLAGTFVVWGTPGGRS